MAKHRKHGDNIEFVPFEPEVIEFDAIPWEFDPQDWEPLDLEDWPAFEPEDWADFALEDWEPPTLDVWADTFEPLAEKSNNVTPKPR